MTTIHYSDLPDTAGIKIFPTGIWAGLMVFGSLWLLPVLILMATTHR